MRLGQFRKYLYDAKIKSQKLCDRLFGPVCRIFLKPRDFTIISCNCWDCAVYSHFQLPYSSPTTNLLFPPKDFLRLIADLPRYMKEDLVQIDLKSFHEYEYVKNRYEKGGFEDKNPANFIYARIGDVDFVAWHYSDFEDLKEKWNRRRERVNYDKILFKMHDLWTCTFDDFKKFLELTEGKNALFLTAKKEWKDYAADNPNVIFVEKYAKAGYVIDDVHHYVLPFNLTRYLNKLWN